MRLKDKLLAIKLRKIGKSYKQIIELIPFLSKGTLSHWLSNITYSEKENQIILKQMQENRQFGLIKSIKTNRFAKAERLKTIREKATQTYIHIKNDTFFIAGLMLYWAEGAKTTERVQFMNSDPRLIVLMLNWFKKYICIPENRIRLRLFIHKIYSHENHKVFWEKIVPLKEKHFLKTFYKPTPHTVKKNPNYKGCIRIDAGGVNEFHMIKSWEEEFTKDHNLILPL